MVKSRILADHPRHCEEHLRRSNPSFLSGGRMDCFAALAMTCFASIVIRNLDITSASLRGALATKQSILSFRWSDGLLRCARNDVLRVNRDPQSRQHIRVIARSTCDEAIHSFFSVVGWIASLRSQ